MVLGYEWLSKILLLLGALGFAPLNNLSEANSLAFETLVFPGDNSFILAACMDSQEDIIFLAKSSKKIYAVDLASSSSEKRPFISKIAQLEDSIVDCAASDKFGLWVLLESGKLLNFSSKGIVSHDNFSV